MNNFNTKCRVCGGKDLHGFFDLGKQPLANSLLDSVDEKENFYPLSLSWCADCNLVQLDYTADREEVFSHYVWVTGTSKVTRDYAQELFRKISEKVLPTDNNYILELASNDGTFLVPFKNNDYKVLGVDPAKNIVDKANEDGIPTICEFFDEESAKKIRGEHGSAKVVIARNVMYHVSNLLSFTKGIADVIADDGLAVMEFHYAKVVQEDLHYDSIYHEHLCYYTLKSFERLLHDVGLNIINVEQSPINRGNIVVYAQKGSVQESSSVEEYKNGELSSKTNSIGSWEEFARRSKFHKEKFNTLLKSEVDKGSSIIGWGSSARSSTLLNYCGVGKSEIPVIVDMNPLKQGKFTAGNHIQIVTDKEAMARNPDVVVILAWNFKDEIINSLKNNYNFNGKCIIPLPDEPYIVDLGDEK